MWLIGLKCVPLLQTAKLLPFGYMLLKFLKLYMEPPNPGEKQGKRPIQPPGTEGIYPPGRRNPVFTLQQVMVKNLRCQLQFE